MSKIRPFSKKPVEVGKDLMEMMKIVEGRAVLAERNGFYFGFCWRSFSNSVGGAILALLFLHLDSFNVFLEMEDTHMIDDHFSPGWKLKTNLGWLNQSFDSRL